MINRSTSEFFFLLHFDKIRKQKQLDWIQIKDRTQRKFKKKKKETEMEKERRIEIDFVTSLSRG